VPSIRNGYIGNSRGNIVVGTNTRRLAFYTGVTHSVKTDRLAERAGAGFVGLLGLGFLRRARSSVCQTDKMSAFQLREAAFRFLVAGFRRLARKALDDGHSAADAEGFGGNA
jgi:hypothetical protein